MLTKRTPWQVVLILLLAAACTRAPVSDELSIEFSEDHDDVVVTAQTSFDLRVQDDGARARIESARQAALAGVDPWSVRFARLEPEVERTTLQRTRGELDRVIRSVRIRSSELQDVFSDTSITVDLLEGDGWRELSFYTGAASRATREQERQFAENLAGWSRSVARYFSAVETLYGYLDSQPSRARYVFAALLHEEGPDGAPPLITEEEQPLVDAVLASMDEIANRMDRQQGRAEGLAEEADLLFNPFPARVTVIAPGDVLSSEGFSASEGRRVVVEPVDLFQAIARLEGRWISPDPLAALLEDEVPSSESMAAIPRRAELVSGAGEIATAIREQLVRPKRYAVRWRE